jgi:hypothetical protein
MTSTDLRFLRPLLVLLGLAGFVCTSARGQDETYQPIPGIERVAGLVQRLEAEGDNLSPAILESLLTEGRDILAVNADAMAGVLPIQTELRAALATDQALADERTALLAQAERTQAEADDFNARFAAHQLYCETDLNPRANALNAAFEDRIARFNFRAGEQFAARIDGKAVKEAMARGERPPLPAAWNYHQHNRAIAEGLAPAENRCALVLSLTLDLKVRPGEASLADVASAIPEVRGAELAQRYVRADELALRLKDLWGEPEEHAPGTGEPLQGRKGVIYFEHGYDDISHIDLWDGAKLGDEIEPAFQSSSRVWFWATE